MARVRGCTENFYKRKLQRIRCLNKELKIKYSNHLVWFAVLLGGLAPATRANELFDASLRDAIESVRIVSDVQRFEPRQSINALGAPIHTSDYRMTATWQPSAARAHERWEIRTIYPIPGEFTFTLTYSASYGVRRGSMGPLGPPGDTEAPIEPARVGASFKDLWLSNPLILSAYAAATPQGPQDFPRTFDAHGTQWTVRADPQTGLPIELSTIEVDPHEGVIENKIVFSDWREVAGVPFPFRLAQFTGDKLVRREVRREIVVNPGDAESILQLPEQPGAANPAEFAWGWAMSHIQLKRGGGGNNHAPQFENVTFEPAGEGIFIVAGSSHHNLLIVGPTGLTLVDASWYAERSETLLAAIAQRWPNLSLKHLILTHHHIDHTGGLRPIVEAGVTVVTSRGNAQYFNDLFARTYAQSPPMIVVDESARLEDTGRVVELYDVMTSHADGMLAAYVPDTRLLFNADLYSPNRELQFQLWQSELMKSIDYHGIEVTRHVGGHGQGYVDVEP